MSQNDASNGWAKKILVEVHDEIHDMAVEFAQLKQEFIDDKSFREKTAELLHLNEIKVKEILDDTAIAIEKQTMDFRRAEQIEREKVASTLLAKQVELEKRNKNRVTIMGFIISIVTIIITTTINVMMP